MAWIDKTYTDNYREYKKFKDWADSQIVTFFDGHKECVGDWVWKLNESDFNDVEIYEGLFFYIGEEYCKIRTIFKDKQIATIVSCNNPNIIKTQLDFESIKNFVLNNREIPIMNTPTWLDIYLIQNCKSKFVIDRMKEVYGTRFKEYQTLTNLRAIPEGYAKNRKIVFKNGNNCKFPFKKKMFNKPMGKEKSWWVQCEDNFWYNYKTKTWVEWGDFYPHNTNTAHISSTKALVRHLRKQYLPKGIKFRISGRYVGEDYIVIIK